MCEFKTLDGSSAKHQFRIGGDRVAGDAIPIERIVAEEAENCTSASQDHHVVFVGI